MTSSGIATPLRRSTVSWRRWACNVCMPALTRALLSKSWPPFWLSLVLTSSSNQGIDMLCCCFGQAWSCAVLEWATSLAGAWGRSEATRVLTIEHVTALVADFAPGLGIDLVEVKATDLTKAAPTAGVDEGLTRYVTSCEITEKSGLGIPAVAVASHMSHSFVILAMRLLVGT